MFDIEGKVALITGGASGIGLHYAKELLRNKLKAVTIADVNEEFGQKALQEIAQEFGKNRAIFVKTDVSNKTQFEEAFKSTVQAFKNIDILINNAGVLKDNNWEWEILINLNATIQGSLLGVETYIPKYRSGPEGVIVNIASVAGLDEFACVPIYSATKHAVIGFSKSLGKQLHYAKTKVKILTLCPGVTDTPLVDLSRPLEKTLGPRYAEMIPIELRDLHPQPIEYVAKGLIKMIKEGESGSVWMVEDKQPACKLVFPKRQDLVKK